MAPPSPVDAVVAALRNAKSARDVFKALTADPLLMVGLVVILAIVLLLGRIYIWPTINPFQIQWIANLWDWMGSPLPPTPQKEYPFAKVTYPT